MKSILSKTMGIIIIFMFILSGNLSAQTPQYYNTASGTVANSFPFNMAGGKAVNSLILAGELNQPTPLPPGQMITKVYFRHSGAGTRVYTDLHILFTQSNLTTLTSGVFDPGPYDTVYHAASTTLTHSIGGWTSITLDHPYVYDPTKSLIMFVGQCGATGTGGSVYNSTFTGIRRVWSVGGCPFAPYASGDAALVNFGVDVVPAAPSMCSKIAGHWCPANTFPNLPTATYFQAAAWIGDTLYVQTPTSTGAGATTVNRYTYGGSWTTGVPCLVGVAGASMSVVNNKLYLIGGGTTSVTTGTNNVQEYNPATGTWTAKAPMPALLATHGSVAWGDSVIFVVGGPYSSAATNLNVHYYRPASDSWGTITNSLPAGQGRRTFALSISGNKIIMTCGYNTAYLKSTYIGTIGSDATQITWAAGPNAPVALSRPAGTSYANYSFLIGGDTNGTAVKNDKIFVYNVTSSTWEPPILNAPHPSSNMINAITMKCINDTARIFQPGGYSTLAFDFFDVVACGDVLVGNSNQTVNVPKKYSLSQNYPNPFNPVTKINYSLPKAGLVSLKVYDMLGREVSVLVNEVKIAGNYIVDFNAGNLTSGVYFYRLESNGFTDVKKMMLIK